MSVQLNKQTCSTRFSGGSLLDWRMYSVKNCRTEPWKTTYIHGRLQPYRTYKWKTTCFLANQPYESWLPLWPLPVLIPRGHTRHNVTLPQDLCICYPITRKDPTPPPPIHTHPHPVCMPPLPQAVTWFIPWSLRSLLDVPYSEGLHWLASLKQYYLPRPSISTPCFLSLPDMIFIAYLFVSHSRKQAP